MRHVKKKPTIATVAQRAGVAVSTVSRYLNGRSVSQHVRARLSAVIEELGYSRSWTARNLSLGRRGCIGVVVDSSQDPWFVQLLTGIEEELSTRDTSLMLASLELRERYDPALVGEWIRERRVDGLIVAKSQRRERPLLRMAVEAGLPIVAVAPDEQLPNVQVVRCNNVLGGATVASHLIGLGHRRIAFVGGPQHAVDSKQRLRGLRDALAESGVAFDPSLVTACASWTVEAGAAFARAFLNRPLRATAVILANDALAFGFMRVAHQKGIRVPHELSIVGFDGLPQGELLWPSLTTMAQPMREMGRSCCQRLFEAIEHPDRRETLEFPMTLIERESTGPVPEATSAAVRHLQVVPRRET